MTTKWTEGDRLKFITTLGEEIIGKVFVHEPETNTLVIRILTCNNLLSRSLIFFKINNIICYEYSYFYKLN